mmetsp:Transcript_10511/g.15788  ORF Transcript_10511/g.15788 Transcript_10511/m.15788 type:complete len:233 (-) Transcript_10511:677-1375(-)
MNEKITDTINLWSQTFQKCCIGSFNNKSEMRNCMWEYLIQNKTNTIQDQTNAVDEQTKRKQLKLYWEKFKDKKPEAYHTYKNVLFQCQEELMAMQSAMEQHMEALEAPVHNVSVSNEPAPKYDPFYNATNDSLRIMQDYGLCVSKNSGNYGSQAFEELERCLQLYTLADNPRDGLLACSSQTSNAVSVFDQVVNDALKEIVGEQHMEGVNEADRQFAMILYYICTNEESWKV